jgi:hypothetical protein
LIEVFTSDDTDLYTQFISSTLIIWCATTLTLDMRHLKDWQKGCNRFIIKILYCLANIWTNFNNSEIGCLMSKNQRLYVKPIKFLKKYSVRQTVKKTKKSFDNRIRKQNFV